MKKIDKNTLKLLAISFILCSIVSALLYSKHYTYDTYMLLGVGFKRYAYECMFGLGRIISYFYLLFLGFLNLNYGVLCVFNNILCCLFSSIAIVKLYNFLSGYFKNNKETKIIIYLLSFLSIVNYYSIEFFFYTEGPMMVLGMLFSVLAAIQIFSEKKYHYIKSFLYLLIAIFSYQPTITMFSTICLFMLLMNKNSFKENIKKLIYIVIVFGSVSLINVLFIKFFLQPYQLLSISVKKYPTEINIPLMLFNLKTTSKSFFIHGINGNPTNLYFYITISMLVIMTIVTLLRKDSPYKLFTFYAVLLLAILFSFTPMMAFGTKERYDALRFHTGTFAIYPLCLTYFYYLINGKMNKLAKRIFIGIIIVLIIITNMVSIKLTINQHVVNGQEKDDITYIGKAVVEHTKKTGHKTTKVLLFKDYNYISDNKEFIISPNAMRKDAFLGLIELYPECVDKFDFSQYSYYLEGVDYNPRINDEYGHIFMEHFYNKNFTYLSKDNVFYIDDTLVVCLY